MSEDAPGPGRATAALAWCRARPGLLLVAVLLIGWLVTGAVSLRRLARPAPEGQLAARRAHTDFDGFWRGGRDVLAGRDIYVLEGSEDAPWSMSPVKRYLPFFAVAMVPFALLPLTAAGLLLHALSGLSLWGSARSASRLAGRDPDADGWPALLGVAVTAPLWTGHLGLGQVGLPVLWLTLAGVERAARAGWRGALAGGALIGLAAALKVTPALVSVWLLLRGRWLAAAASGAAFLALCASTAAAFGPAGALELHGRWLREHGSTARAAFSAEGLSLRYANASLAATVGRLVLDENAGGSRAPFQVNVARLEPAAAERLLDALQAAALAGLGALAARRWRRGDRRLDGSSGSSAAELGVVLALVAVFTPIAWTHHFVVLLPGAVALAAAGDRASRGWLVAAAALQLTLVSPVLRALGGVLLADLAIAAGCAWLVWTAPAPVALPAPAERAVQAVAA